MALVPPVVSSLRLVDAHSTERKRRPFYGVTAGTAAASVSPPVAKRVAHTVTFGKVEGENRGTNPMEPVELQDDLFWIRDDTRKNEEVRSTRRALGLLSIVRPSD